MSEEKVPKATQMCDSGLFTVKECKLPSFFLSLSNVKHPVTSNQSSLSCDPAEVTLASAWLHIWCFDFLEKEAIDLFSIKTREGPFSEAEFGSILNFRLCAYLK